MVSNVIRIYNHNATEDDFKGNGIAALTELSDVKIAQEVSGAYSLEFNAPNVQKLKFIAEENIAVVDGQRFRIKKISDTQVSAQAIYTDAGYKHIQYLPNMIGETPRNIMLSIFEGTPVEIMEESEVRVLGMEWVSDLTDFFECSKLTPLGALDTLMATLEKYKIHAELYVDNYKIALVKQIGVDRGARLDMRYNAAEIKADRDTTEMITRLYPYGADDLHIGSVNNDKQYIDSPNYAKFPREGYMDFSAIEDPEELLKAAQAQFDEDNPDRIDIPKYSISATYAQRKPDEIRLGDIVTVNDIKYGLVSKQRVIAIEKYPFEPHRNSVTLGHTNQSATDIFNGLISSNAGYENSLNAKGEIKPAWLENLKEGYKTAINTSLESNVKEGRKTVIHDYGDIWVNPDNPNQAVALVGGVLAMANGKTPEGDWDWSAFGDWTGFTADVITAGRLITDKVEVMSADGKLWISGGLITVFDSVRSRMRIGYDEINGEYIFEITDKSGKDTIKMDDTGQIEVSGTIYSGDTEDDAGQVAISGGTISGAKVVNGKTVAHGFSCTTDYENLENIVKAYLACNGLIGISIDVTANAAGVATATLFNQYMSFLRLNGGFTYAEGKWDFSSADVSGLGGASGTFVDANGKLVRVTDGIITFIGN